MDVGSVSSSGTPTALSLNLSAFGKLTAADRDLLKTTLTKRVRTVPARRDIVREGDRPHFVNVVLEGWAQRSKQLADGRRQILSFLLPGELCDPNIFILKRLDHTLSTVTTVRLGEVPKQELRELVQARPAIAEALWWTELVAGAIQREWTTSIGQRTAYERIAHLFCELFVRSRTAGLTDANTCEFPLTQSDIADATGMTQVHVNRTIQEMRRDGLIDLRSRQMTVHDLDRLMAVALFNTNYLHLDHRADA
ncbi:Crp/Fnr family transcriptional regulator [Novosphingobium soli]|uniref:Crp/Fnr family transcriptional regulator n=1 Tax=Novosphingobium soli TaxID=574956 RepID=A0ABV6CTJ1_9SPHN